VLNSFFEKNAKKEESPNDTACPVYMFRTARETGIDCFVVPVPNGRLFFV
jgi:hypothetical protein